MIDLVKAAEPKSDQLNADDLTSGPIRVVIDGVKQGPSKEQPVQIELVGRRPYRPCKSMLRVLIACWGDDGARWIGRSMVLGNDPSVKYGGVAVGGIRVQSVSDIDQQRSVMLTVTRTKRMEYTVDKLVDIEPTATTGEQPPYTIYYPGDKRVKCMGLKEYAERLTNSSAGAREKGMLKEFKELNEDYIMDRIKSADERLASALIDEISQ